MGRFGWIGAYRWIRCQSNKEPSKSSRRPTKTLDSGHTKALVLPLNMPVIQPRLLSMPQSGADFLTHGRWEAK